MYVVMTREIVTLGVSLICSRSDILFRGIHCERNHMATWMKCTTADGREIVVNADNVAIIHPHNRDRGGTGSEITFAGVAPSSLVVREGQQELTGQKI